MDDEQLLRYSRQIMLPQFGIAAQQAFLDAHVVVAGLGGLGSPVAMYLAAAGIGALTIIDHDNIDISNLQRQILYGTSDIKKSKVDTARIKLNTLNPDTRIRSVDHKPSASEWTALADSADVVVDATDNFATRFAINKACVSTRTALVSGAAIRLEGQLMVYDPSYPDCACYRCLYAESGELEQTCSENGILAPVVGIIGSMQSLETLKLLAGQGSTLASRLLVLDAQCLEFRTLTLRRDPHCPVCGEPVSETR